MRPLQRLRHRVPLCSVPAFCLGPRAARDRMILLKFGVRSLQVIQSCRRAIPLHGHIGLAYDDIAMSRTGSSGEACIEMAPSTHPILGLTRGLCSDVRRFGGPCVGGGVAAQGLRAVPPSAERCLRVRRDARCMGTPAASRQTSRGRDLGTWYVRVYKYVYNCACAHACTFTPASTYTNARILICRYAYLHLYIHLHLHLHIHMYICIRVYI